MRRHEHCGHGDGLVYTLKLYIQLVTVQARIIVPFCTQANPVHGLDHFMGVTPHGGFS